MKLKSNPVLILWLQLGLTALLPLFWPKDSLRNDWIYLLFGSLVSASQFGLLLYVWWRIFTKKKIAPSVIAVVIKYALLGLTFWYLSPLSSSHTTALTVGIMTNLVAIFLFTIIHSRKIRLENERKKEEMRRKMKPEMKPKTN